MAATNRPSTATTIAPTNENPLVKTDKVTGETLLAVFKPPHAFEECARTLVVHFSRILLDLHAKGRLLPVIFKDTELPEWYEEDADRLLDELRLSSIVALRSRIPVHEGFRGADQDAYRQSTRL